MHIGLVIKTSVLRLTLSLAKTDEHSFVNGIFNLSSLIRVRAARFLNLFLVPSSAKGSRAKAP